MPDPIQSTSSIPVPYYQTNIGATDPAAPSSNASTVKDDNRVATNNKDQETTNFENYLNQQSITVLQANSPTTTFDPVAELQKNGVYQQPGQNTPV